VPARDRFTNRHLGLAGAAGIARFSESQYIVFSFVGIAAAVVLLLTWFAVLYNGGGQRDAMLLLRLPGVEDPGTGRLFLG
jgi:hypothetical protein